MIVINENIKFIWNRFYYDPTPCYCDDCGTDIAVTGKYGIAEIEELRNKQSKFKK